MNRTIPTNFDLKIIIPVCLVFFAICSAGEAQVLDYLKVIDAYFLILIAPGMVIRRIWQGERNNFFKETPVYFGYSLIIISALIIPAYFSHMSFSFLLGAVYFVLLLIFISIYVPYFNSNKIETGAEESSEDKGAVWIGLMAVAMFLWAFYLGAREVPPADNCEVLLMIRKITGSCGLNPFDFFVAVFGFSHGTYSYNIVLYTYSIIFKAANAETAAFIKLPSIIAFLYFCAFYRFVDFLFKDKRLVLFILCFLFFFKALFLGMMEFIYISPIYIGIILLLLCFEMTISYMLLGKKRDLVFVLLLIAMISNVYMGMMPLYLLGVFGFFVVRFLKKREKDLAVRYIMVTMTSLLIFGTYYASVHDSYVTRLEWNIENKSFESAEIKVGENLKIIKPEYFFSFNRGYRLGWFNLCAIILSLFLLRRKNELAGSFLVPAMWITPLLLFNPITYPILTSIIPTAKVFKVFPLLPKLLAPIIMGYLIWKVSKWLGPIIFKDTQADQRIKFVFILSIAAYSLFAVYHDGYAKGIIKGKRDFISRPDPAVEYLKSVVNPGSVVLSPTYKLGVFTDVRVPHAQSELELQNMLNPAFDIEYTINLIRKYKVEYVMQVNSEKWRSRNEKALNQAFGIKKRMVFEPTKFNNNPAHFQKVFESNLWVVFKVIKA